MLIVGFVDFKILLVRGFLEWRGSREVFPLCRFGVEEIQVVYPVIFGDVRDGVRSCCVVRVQFVNSEDSLHCCRYSVESLCVVLLSEVGSQLKVRGDDIIFDFVRVTIQVRAHPSSVADNELFAFASFGSEIHFVELTGTDGVLNELLCLHFSISQKILVDEVCEERQHARNLVEIFWCSQNITLVRGKQSIALASPWRYVRSVGVSREREVYNSVSC